MKFYKFSSETNSAFSSALIKRVNRYFSINKISKKGNNNMVIKSIMAFSIYLIPYGIIVLIAPGNLWLLFGLWAVMGIGHTFIGTSVMHDTLHGSYANNRLVNRIVGFSTWLIGVNAANWKIQHNTLHHTYTNVDHIDEDIEPKFIFRFSPHQPRRWFHSYQHIYAVFFYALSTLQWAIAKDFVKAVKYLKEGLIKPRAHFRHLMLDIVLGKIFYFFFFLVIPILVLPVSGLMVFAMFVVMHLTAGLLISFIFQCAHVMPSSEFISQENELIEENRLVHQLNTTTNFGMKSQLLFWFSGGLNHQIEHHLFTDICHVHYRLISRIVRRTAKEFGLPYHAQPSMYSAIISHLGMLKALGTGKI